MGSPPQQEIQPILVANATAQSVYQNEDDFLDYDDRSEPANVASPIATSQETEAEATDQQALPEGEEVALPRLDAVDTHGIEVEFPRYYCGAVTHVNPKVIPRFVALVNLLHGALQVAVGNKDIHRQKTASLALLEAPAAVFLGTANGVQRPTGEVLARIERLLSDPDPPMAVLRSRPSPPQSDREPTRPANAAERDVVSPALGKRVTKLVRANRASRALQMLESSADNELVDMDSNGASAQAARATLPSLFPARCPIMDTLPVAVDPSPLRLSRDDVAAAVRFLPKGSAAGLSSWSFELIQALVHSGDDNGLSLVTDLSNDILRGRCGPADVWCAARFIPLRKKDSTPTNPTIRPIAVMDVWVRFVGRVVAKQLSQSAATKLVPLQLGVGVPSATELVAHATSLIVARVFDADCAGVTDDLTVLQIDFANAFNTIRRGAIWQGIQTHMPQIAQFFHWAYQGPAPLWTRLGRSLGHVSTGVRQGDPLGPLYFALGIQRLLERVAAAHPNVRLAAYLDDVHLFGSTRDMMEAYDHFRDLAPRECGLQVNPAKCKLLHRPSSSDVDELVRSNPAAPAPEEDGLTVLGVPVGMDEFVADEVEASFQTQAAVLRLVEQLPGPTAFPLVQACVNARPQYLARCVAPHHTEGPATAFDAAIDSTLFRMCGRSTRHLQTLPECSSLIRGLPVQMGGTSIRRIRPVTTPSYTASVLRSLAYIQSKVPGLWELMDIHNNPNTEHLMSLVKELVPNLLSATTSTEGQGSVGSPRFPSLVTPAGLPVQIPSQAQLTAPVDKAIRHRVVSTIGHANALAWFCSQSCVGTASWLWSGLSSKDITSLKPDNFSEALALRLLLPAVSGDADGARQCGLCQTRSADSVSHDFGYHGLLCPSIAGRRCARHLQVINALAGFAKAMKCTVNKEVRVPELDPAAQLRLDLRIVHQGQAYFVDVTVVSPAAPGRMSAVPNPSADQDPFEAGYASRLAEAEKAAKYSLHVPPQSFVPFVVEATGRLGARAAEFIEALCPTTSEDPSMAKARQFFMRRLSVTTQSFNAELVRAYRGAVAVCA